jgi:hypothetical protein
MWIYDFTIIIIVNLSSRYFIVWIYDNVFVWDKGCHDNVVVLYYFPFIRIVPYPLSTILNL